MYVALRLIIQKKTDGRKPEGIENVHEKYKFYNIKPIFTFTGQNTAEFYYKLILLTVLVIFLSEFGMKFTLFCITSNGKQKSFFLNIAPHLDTISS